MAASPLAIKREQYEYEVCTEDVNVIMNIWLRVIKVKITAMF